MSKEDIEAIEARHVEHVLVGTNDAGQAYLDRAALLDALKERDAEIATLTDRAATAERELCGAIAELLQLAERLSIRGERWA